MKTAKYSLLFSFVVLGSALFVSSVIVVAAQTAATSSAVQAASSAEQGIVFPVPELGNCTSRDECRSYCNQVDHMDGCITFAKVHGLMNKDEASRADKFRKSLQGGGGPGGCKTPDECRTFCNNINNLDACVKFAQSQGVKTKEVEEGSKILTYIKNGGQLPGGCASKDNCQTYCGDFSHAKECYEFSQKAGIQQSSDQAQGAPADIPSGQFQKFLELVQKGQTPGGCKSKDECEAYCKAQGHLDECLKFGQAAGFIPSDQAEKLRQLGGKGPGGCDSPEACSGYCNASEHQQECFSFAKEHGLIPSQQLEQAQTGLVRLREGLSQAPPEVTACLKSKLGPDVINDIQAGKLAPGSQIGQELRGCFETFGHHSNPGDVLKNAPPNVVACLKEKLGADFDAIASGQTTPTVQTADTFRICSQQVSFGESRRFQGPANASGSDQGQTRIGAMPAPDVNQFLRSAPPAVVDCLKGKLGDTFEKLKSGEIQPQPEMESTVKGCLEQFRPSGQKGEFMQGQENKSEGGPQGQNFNQPGQNRGEYQPNSFRQSSQSPSFPPEIAQCLKEKLGDGVVAKIQSGELPTGDIKKVAQSCMQSIKNNFPNFRGAPDSSPPQYFQSPQYPEHSPPYPQGAPGCYDMASCQKVCFDSTSPYYSNDTCVKFRNYQSGTPSSSYNQSYPLKPDERGAPFMPPSGTSSTYEYKPPYPQTSTYQSYPGAASTSYQYQQQQYYQQQQPYQQYPSKDYNYQDQYQATSNTSSYPSPPSQTYPSYPTSQPSGTSPIPCASGQYWNGSSCITAAPSGSSDPATMCAKSGGTWTGSTCQMSSSAPSPTPSPTPTISPSAPSTDMATMCAKGGGTWTGSTCKMP